jgi:hypothetical protein
MKLQELITLGERMPASIIKHKQKLANMTDQELADRFKDFDETRLRQMAWRHGYGKMSPYYWDRVQKGKSVSEAKKPKPTNPSKWAYYKSQAKQKFDVYPSAYANAWAAKMYKKAGGGWRMSKEAIDGLQYHFDNAIPLRETIYRPGSTAFFEMFELARALYEQGMISVDWEDAELLETDIGDVVKTTKGDIALDIPFEAKESWYKDGVEMCSKECCGAPVKDCTCGPDCEHCNCYNKNKKVNEAEYQGKKVELNKPKRGGSKKFYVYTRNPKTGNIKKVSWGDTTGLSVKAHDPARVRSFVARHDCKNAKDKTKASYWACRTPRYKSLGVKGGQWW